MVMVILPQVLAVVVLVLVAGPFLLLLALIGKMMELPWRRAPAQTDAEEDADDASLQTFCKSLETEPTEVEALRAEAARFDAIAAMYHAHATFPYATVDAISRANAKAKAAEALRKSTAATLKAAALEAEAPLFAASPCASMPEKTLGASEGRKRGGRDSNPQPPDRQFGTRIRQPH